MVINNAGVGIENECDHILDINLVNFGLIQSYWNTMLSQEAVDENEVTDKDGMIVKDDVIDKDEM